MDFTDETPGKPIGHNTKVNSVPFENRHSLTTAIDLDEAAYRIRDVPDMNSKMPHINRVKSEGGLVGSDNNLSNGDLAINGSGPIVANGNSRMSAGSDRSRKDLSLGDIDSRISPGSPPEHDLARRDTIVTVQDERNVKDCCPAFCYCPGICCDHYRDSCLRRTWHQMRFHVCAFVEHKYFEWFILSMIVISSLTLVGEAFFFFA